MFRRFLILVLASSALITIPDRACLASTSDFDMGRHIVGPMLATGIMWTGICLVVTTYNLSGLRSDDPSKGGGALGLVTGTATMLLGGAAFVFPEPEITAMSVAAFSVGAYTAYVGVKSLAEVRRKYIEEEEHGLTISPILIKEGPGKVRPGLQVSFQF
jgi:hypothetical protein